MATTIHIESELIATSSVKPLNAQLWRILQRFDAFIDRFQDSFLTLSLFKKDPEVEHHLNLLLEVNEHEPSCAQDSNRSVSITPRSHVGTKLYVDNKEYRSLQNKAGVTLVR